MANTLNVNTEREARARKKQQTCTFWLSQVRRKKEDRMAVDILNKSLEGTINLLFAITCLKMGLPVRNSCSASECGQHILTTKVANDR